MKEIILTQGKIALVDDEDFEYLKWYRWHTLKSQSKSNLIPNYYARNISMGLMHRTILNPPDNMEIDHINGDTLDNRKENLRIVSKRQNLQNHHSPKSSVYPGVCWHKRQNKWISNISINGVKKHLGMFEYEKEAAEAYVHACKTIVKEDPISIQ